MQDLKINGRLDISRPFTLVTIYIHLEDLSVYAGYHLTISLSLYLESLSGLTM